MIQINDVTEIIIVFSHGTCFEGRVLQEKKFCPADVLLDQ
jgi:hypothetical protein